MKRLENQTLLVVSIGLLIGILGGLAHHNIASETSLSDLSPSDQLDVLIVFAESYLNHRDMDQLQRDISRFSVTDLSKFVIHMTERAILTGRSSSEICPLVDVSQRFGYVTSAMEPYLDCARGGGS